MNSHLNATFSTAQTPRGSSNKQANLAAGWLPLLFIDVIIIILLGLLILVACCYFGK